MELKVNHEVLTATEVVFDGMQEQSVELDYLLPDYYPDIFKIIKCIMKPRILSYSVNGSKVTCEMSVCIKVMYCSETGSGVRCIDQKLNYSKIIDIGRTAENPVVSCTARTDYVNCRAVSQKRLDIRGAVSIKLKVSADVRQEVVSDAFGMGIQLKKRPVTFAAAKLHATKLISISEELDLGMSKPALSEVIRSDAVIASYDKKIIANKLIVKGEAYVNLLYSCTKEGADALEAMQFMLPFSQIIDMEGVDQRFECFIGITVTSCEVTPSGDEERKKLQCELSMMIACRAYRTASVNLVSDAYSTACACESRYSAVRIESAPIAINETLPSKTSIEYKDGEIRCIYDAWSSVHSLSSRMNSEDGSLMISGSLLYCVMVKSASGAPAMLEKEVTFEFAAEASGLTPDSSFDGSAYSVSCSYNLVSTSTVDVKSEIRLSGIILNISTENAVSAVEADEEAKAKRDGDYALKLYYAQDDEDIWEIAKKYLTSVAAIQEENQLDGDLLTEGRMLLIPMVD